MHSDNVI